MVNVIVSALQPAVAEMATRFGVEKTLVDVNWADAGIAWGWPGVAGLIVSLLVVNILMLVLKTDQDPLDRCLVLLAWFCSRRLRLGVDRWQRISWHSGWCLVSGGRQLDE